MAGGNVDIGLILTEGMNFVQGSDVVQESYGITAAVIDTRIASRTERTNILIQIDPDLFFEDY